MAPVTDSRTSEAGDLALRWSGQVSLTQRILAVNIVALLLLAGGFFYLDSYRSRIVDYRVAQSLREARLIGEALNTSAPKGREALLTRLATDTGLRLRVFDAAGALVADSRALGVRNFGLIDPDKQGWRQEAARALDAMIDTVVGAPRAPLYRERRVSAWWPSVRRAAASRSVRSSGARPTARPSSPPPRRPPMERPC